MRGVAVFLLTALTAPALLTGQTACAASTKAAAKDWQPHKYIADDGVSVLTEETVNDDGSITYSGFRSGGAAMIGASCTQTLALHKEGFSVRFGIGATDYENENACLNVALLDRLTVTNDLNGTAVYKQWDNTYFRGEQGRGLILSLYPRGEDRLSVRMSYVGVTSEDDPASASGLISLDGYFTDIRLHSGTLSDIRLDLTRGTDGAWRVTVNGGLFDLVDADGNVLPHTGDSINPDQPLRLLNTLFTEENPAYLKFAQSNSVDAETSFAVRSLNGAYAAGANTRADWGVHNYLIAGGASLSNTATVTQDGALQLNGGLVQWSGELGVTYKRPIDLSRDGFDVTFSLDQYAQHGSNGADSWIALMLSDTDTVTDTYNVSPVYHKLQAGSGDVAYGSGLLILIRPMADNTLGLGEIYWNGVRFSDAGVSRENAFDRDANGCYDTIRVDSFSDIKFSVRPDGNGGVKIVVNDGDYTRVNGSRIDSEGEINPNNKYKNLLRLFDADTPCYMKLVYCHNQSSAAQFTVKEINGQAAIDPASSATPDSGIYELLPDSSYENGFRVSGLNSAQEASQSVYTFNYGDDSLTPIWKIAQWDNRYSLRDSNVTSFTDAGNGTYIYENPSNRITADTENGILALRCNASATYSSPRKSGESWPHLLIEDSGWLARKGDAGTVYIANLSELRLNVSQKLSYFSDRMDGAADSGLHAAQFCMYFYLKGTKPDGQVEQTWFGMTLFDNRTPYPGETYSQDNGKSDASGLFIYCLPYGSLVNKTFHQNGTPVGSEDNPWITLNVDLIPYIRRALTLAQQNGFMQGVEYESLYLDGVNLGWEMPGTYNAEMQVKDFSLKAYSEVTSAYGTISFDANGGTGAPESILAKPNTGLVLPRRVPVRDGYAFAGWATTPNGAVRYRAGGTYRGSVNVTLYAVWTATPGLTPQSNTKMKLDGGLLVDVPVGTTAAILPKYFRYPASSVLRVTDPDGTVTPGILATGSTVTLYDAQGSISEQYTVVISGDCNGNGIPDSNDGAIIRNACIGLDTLPAGSAQERAADLNGNGRIDSNDYILQRKSVLGIQ